MINADATVVAELEEEQVGKADFFVATSESDEDNVMTCLQANNIGTRNCLTIIHRADYAHAIGSSGRHFGVVAAVSPREATRRDIERYLTTEKFCVVKKFTAGQVIETDVAEGAKVAGARKGAYKSDGGEYDEGHHVDPEDERYRADGVLGAYREAAKEHVPVRGE